MARPTGNLPDFATSSGRVEPGSGLKATGWALGDRPAASHHNYLFGKLGDWVRFLSDVTSGVAVTDLKIRFATSDSTEANTPLVVATRAEDHSSGNLWKPLLRAAAGTGRAVRLFSGKLGTTALGVTVNAAWDPATQLWSQELNSIDSFFFGLDNIAGLTVARKTAGSPAWSSWGGAGTTLGGTSIATATITTTGDITVGDDLHVTGSTLANGGLAVTGVATVTGAFSAASVHSDDDIEADDDFFAGGDYRYTVSTDRVITRSAASAAIQGPATYSNGTDAISGDSSGVSGATWEIEVPSGCALTQIQVMHTAVAPSTMTVTCYRRTATDWTSTPANTGSNTVVATGSNAFNGLQVTTLNVLETPARASRWYRVTILVEDNSVSKVHGMRYTFSDAGPRNF